MEYSVQDYNYEVQTHETKHKNIEEVFVFVLFWELTTRVFKKKKRVNKAF